METAGIGGLVSFWLRVIVFWYWFIILPPAFVYLKRKKLKNKIAFIILGIVSGYIIHIATGYLSFILREKLFVLVGDNVLLIPVAELLLRILILYVVLSVIAKGFRTKQVSS